MVLIKVFVETEYFDMCFLADSIESFRKENNKNGYMENKDYRIRDVLELRLKGSDYSSNKTILESIAIEYSNNFQYLDGLAWDGEIKIKNWFERYGKKYGLLTEFRENGII